MQLSYTGPRVNNENPLSEALFSTLKYLANWSSAGFNDLAEARN